MRLIDADKLLEKLDKPSVLVDRLPWTILETVRNIVKSQPTAYEIDKVVEELEKLKQYKLNIGDAVCNIQANGINRHFICLEDAIEIVKQGVR